MITIFVVIPVTGDKTYQLVTGLIHGPKIPFLHQAVIRQIIRTLTVDAQVPVRVVIRNWRDADDIVTLLAGNSPVMRTAVSIAIDSANRARNSQRKSTGVIYDGSEDTAATQQ